MPRRATRPKTEGPASPRGPRDVLILANENKEGVADLAGEMRRWLSGRVDAVRVTNRGAAGAGEGRNGRPDLLVVLGGDGTLLDAVRRFGDDPVPIVGINFGRIGFLASTPARHWKKTLECVLSPSGEEILEPRMRLLVEWEQSGRVERKVALNDVVVQRASHQGMLTISLWVGADLVTNYRADGLILATPSGSTAYSLSAGGPILLPSLSAIAVTPISPQGLSNRPIVLHPESALALSVTDSAGISTLALDGQSYHALPRGQVVRVTRHPVPYPLYAMPGLDPFRRLRSRLGWRGSVEPDRAGARPEASEGDPLPPEEGQGVF